MRNNLQRNQLFLLCILLGAFVFRFYGFTNPIADWHSWRQADTSAVSRNFTKLGFDILHPRFDDLSNVPSGKENPLGYRFVEFPIYNIFQAGLFSIFHFFTLEEWGRLVTIATSLFTTLFLYLLMRRHSNETMALLAAFFYAFFPFDIYYGRVILPDPSMVMAIIGGIYFFDRWIQARESTKTKKTTGNSSLQKHDVFLIFSLVFTTSAFLLKPFALFFTLPILYLAIEHFRYTILKQWKLYFFLVVSILPLVWWRLWISHYPEGIPASNWLFNEGNIRFRPAYFRWILYERLTKLIAGFTGLIPLIVGFYSLFTNKKEGSKWKLAGFIASFLLSSVLYVIVIARGNVQHDYYQILIMPSIAILFAFGTYTLLQTKFLPLAITKTVVVVLIATGLFISGNQVKDYFNINNPNIVVAGRAVDRLTPKDAKVIAPYGGDTSFLYQTNRQGWAEFEKTLPDMITQLGATYLILVNPSKQDLNGFGKEYTIVLSTPQYLLLKLN